MKFHTVETKYYREDESVLADTIHDSLPSAEEHLKSAEEELLQRGYQPVTFYHHPQHPSLIKIQITEVYPQWFGKIPPKEKP